MAAKRKIPKALAWTGLGLAIAIAVLLIVYTLVIAGGGERAAQRERQLAEARATLASRPSSASSPQLLPATPSPSPAESPATHDGPPTPPTHETPNDRYRALHEDLVALGPNPEEFASRFDADFQHMLAYSRAGTHASYYLLALHAWKSLGDTLPQPLPPIEWPKLPASFARYPHFLNRSWVKEDVLTSPSLALRRDLDRYLDGASSLLFNSGFDPPPPSSWPEAQVDEAASFYPTQPRSMGFNPADAAAMVLLRDASLGSLPEDHTELRRRLLLTLDLHALEPMNYRQLDRFFDLLHHPAVARRLTDDDLAALQHRLAEFLLEPGRAHAMYAADLLHETEEAIRELDRAEISGTSPLAHFMDGAVGRVAQNFYAPIIRRHIHEASQAALDGDREAAVNALGKAYSAANSIGLRLYLNPRFDDLLRQSSLSSEQLAAAINRPIRRALFLLGVMRTWRAQGVAEIDSSHLPAVYTPVPIVLPPDQPLCARPASHGGPILIEPTHIYEWKGDIRRGFRAREFGSPFDLDVIAWQLAPPERAQEFERVYTEIIRRMAEFEEAGKP